MTKPASAPKEPTPYFISLSEISDVKARLAAGDAALQPALDKLVRDADEAMLQGPFSVTHKTLTPPSGDKHDYMSIGSYWWPDPEKPDGLPYIRRDGETSPARFDSSTDALALDTMGLAVSTLAIAHYFTGNAAYAEHAGKLLRVWFLDSETKMNPHLQFGQAIPGRLEGRDIGIIDTHKWIAMLDSIALLEQTPAWTENDWEKLHEWFDAYLTWLLTSEHGQGEKEKKNNHGTWYDVQVTRYALFAGRTEVAQPVLENVQEKRLAPQIEPDGRQPHELARTMSFTYSLMNLRGFFELAAMGEALGMDLWHFETEDGRSLRRALDFLAPYSNPAREWPHQQINPMPREQMLALLRKAARVSGDKRYEEYAAQLPAGALEHRSQLLFPARAKG